MRTTATKALRIGDVMPDGSIYAGVSPDTGRAMFATPKDTGLCGEWQKAMAHAAKLYAHEHRDWRVPTKAELNVLFRNRAAIGNFDISGCDPGSWYWSSSHNLKYFAWIQCFRSGFRSIGSKLYATSLRCVRG